MIPHPWSHGKDVAVWDYATFPAVHRVSLKDGAFVHTTTFATAYRIEICKSQSTPKPLESETGKGEMRAGDHK